MLSPSRGPLRQVELAAGQKQQDDEGNRIEHQSEDEPVPHRTVLAARDKAVCHRHGRHDDDQPMPDRKTAHAPPSPRVRRPADDFQRAIITVIRAARKLHGKRKAPGRRQVRKWARWIENQAISRLHFILCGPMAPDVLKRPGPGPGRTGERISAAAWNKAYRHDRWPWLPS